MSYNDDYCDLLRRYELLQKEREEWTFKRSVINEFYRDVVAMRKAQRSYFATRLQGELTKCKVAESRVDEGISRIAAMCKGGPRPQQQTFDFGGAL